MKEILNIRDLFNINKGDVISIVGTGGKTTLLFYLAAELKLNFNVLLTTSTKIFKPADDIYDHLFYDVESFINSNKTKKNGITVISKSYNEKNNKLLGIDDNDLEKLLKHFDVILIEADGSRNLPLKGWKNHEPPVLMETNKTIGIIPIKVIGSKIDEKIIYGFEEFLNLIDNNKYKYVNEEVIKNICFSEKGLFKNSKGERYLLINQVDDDCNLEKAINLSKYLNLVSDNLFFKICMGSLKKEVFYEY